MIRGLDGGPLQVGLLEPSAGIIHKDDGSKVLVFIDPPTEMQIHIPMTDEQMDALHQEWHKSKLVIAGVDQMPRGAHNGNNGSG